MSHRYDADEGRKPATSGNNNHRKPVQRSEEDCPARSEFVDNLTRKRGIVPHVLLPHEPERADCVVHVKGGKPLTPTGAKILDVPWSGK